MDGLGRTGTLSPAASSQPSTPWQVRWYPAPHAGMRLICLPHAGGGAAAYRAWAASLAPDIEVVAIRLPGREARFRERPFTRLDDLVPPLVADLEPVLDRPYAWFGHSLGALIAFEATRLIRRLRLPEPRRLIVSGRPAPHLLPRDTPVHRAPTSAFLQRLREMNGTPAEILDDPAAISSLLPTLRADFAVAETYRCRPGPPLEQPISVYGGTTDAFAAADELRAWSRHSVAGCTVRMLEGGHFFLHQFHERLLPLVRADLEVDSIAPAGRAT
jgi:medium-chain acyl-[acyl-carrier-protein] hydrolase